MKYEVTICARGFYLVSWWAIPFAVLRCVWDAIMDIEVDALR